MDSKTIFMKSFFRKIRHKIIIKKLVMPEHAAVLDTSCQDGRFLAVLLGRNKGKNLSVSGIDISAPDIDEARKLITHGVFKATDNNSIPFGDKTFDVVISSLTLHHMNDPLNSIKEMGRVVKDEGSVYLIDIIAEGSFYNFILKYIKCPEPYHFEKFYSLLELEGLLDKAGLAIHNKVKILAFPTFSIVTPMLLLELKKKKC